MWYTIITILYIRFPELIHLVTGSLYPLTIMSPYSPPLNPGSYPSILYFHKFGVCVVGHLLSRVCLFATPWTVAHQAFLSFTNSWSLLILMSIESVMPSNHLAFCCTLLFLPSIFPNIRVFSNESALRISWPKYWSFSFSISRSNAYLGLISFRTDWSPCSPRDSQESSPTPQLKSINSSAFSFLYGPTLTSIHDYWKNHSFD